MASRPVVTVFDASGSKSSTQLPLPDVFQAPIRADVILQAHRTLSNRLRQPYAVTYWAGQDVSAESWGTGRAVARIPRVNGSGTHRAGQATFGNMCRGGRMYNPTRIWRRWCGRLSNQIRRFATVSAIAASAQSAIVMGRGHRIEKVSEIPLVASDAIESFSKTKQAVQFLHAVGAYADVERCRDTRHVRAGKGKARGRRYKNRKGPLVIYKQNRGIARAFRTIPGVDLCAVDRLNLLKLAPGARPGRFIIWTESAFKDLTQRFGSYDGKTASSNLVNHGTPFRMPEASMRNTDLTSIIESDAVQSIITKPKVNVVASKILKTNPLKNWKAMRRLNPYGVTQVRNGILKQQRTRVYRQKLASGEKLPEKVQARLDKEKKHAKALRTNKLRQQIMSDVHQ